MIKYYKLLEITEAMLNLYFNVILVCDDNLYYKLDYYKLPKNLQTRINKKELDEIVFMRHNDCNLFTIIDTEQVVRVKEFKWKIRFAFKRKFSLIALFSGNVRSQGYVKSIKGELHYFVMNSEKDNGYEIHHRTNTFDNRRSRLRRMKKELHKRYHSKRYRKNWWRHDKLEVIDLYALQELVNYL